MLPASASFSPMTELPELIRGGWLVRPGGLRAKQPVGIPVAGLIVRQMRHQPIPHEILRVPQVDHTGVGKSSTIPLVARIKGEFDRPDDIDVQLGGSIFL